MSEQDSDKRFRVIEGDGKRPSKRIGKKRREAWECKVCEIDTGWATTNGIKMRAGIMLVDGRVAKTNEYWVCAACIGRGKITRIT
ncbi:MAG: hypothetical protein AAF141_15515 [Pseudomonadota bacterium]